MTIEVNIAYLLDIDRIVNPSPPDTDKANNSK